MVLLGRKKIVVLYNPQDFKDVRIKTKPPQVCMVIRFAVKTNDAKYRVYVMGIPLILATLIAKTRKDNSTPTECRIHTVFD